MSHRAALLLSPSTSSFMHSNQIPDDTGAAPLGELSVVVINMDRDTDRLSFMSSQLARLGLPFRRFPAIVGNDLPSELSSYFDRREEGFLSAGEIGCYASHLAVYEAIENGSIPGPALVLEDDVALPDDFAELLRELLRMLPEGWDFVRLSSPSKRAYVVSEKLRGDRALVRYSISPGSNGAILVSQAGARKFRKPIERRLPIDQDNRRLWDFDLNLYGVVPAPVGGNSLGTSTIDDLKAKDFRNDPARQNFLRRERALWRHHAWNIQRFGLRAWAVTEATNIVVPMLPKRSRPKVLADVGGWVRSFANPAH